MALSASKTPAAPKKPGAPKKPTTKSKTGNSACSEAASNWQLAIRGKEPLDPGTYKTLAKCRALTSTRKRADADVKGGKITETARTGIENRLQSRFDRGLITKKDRTARAKELVAARQKRAISTEERQRAATITEKVTGQKVVQRAEKPMKGQKRTETAAPAKPTLSQGKELVQKVREKEQQRAEAKSGVRTLKTSDIQADPTRFQYKLNTANPAGVTNQFKETKVWNPELAGVVQVWRDPANNQTYVVNGHHRFELAQRLGVKNLNVQYIKAATDKEARQKGALTNIAEGRGTSTDAAKFMRDSPNVKDWHEEFRKSGISLSERTASEGLALKDLHPEIFRKVVDELTPVSRAAAIGRAGLHPEDQLALFRKAEAGGWTAGKTGEFATEMKNSARVKTGGGGLFGDDEETSVFEHRAALADRLKTRLAGDKNLFNKVARTRNAGRIESVGANKIDVSASAARATDAENALMTFDSERKFTGRVNTELNKFGQRMATGEKIDKIYGEFEKRMLQTLRLTSSGAFDRRKARLDAMTPEQRARANAIAEKVTRPALPATVAEPIAEPVVSKFSRNGELAPGRGTEERKRLAGQKLTERKFVKIGKEFFDNPFMDTGKTFGQAAKLLSKSSQNFGPNEYYVAGKMAASPRGWVDNVKNAITIQKKEAKQKREENWKPNAKDISIIQAIQNKNREGYVVAKQRKKGNEYFGYESPAYGHLIKKGLVVEQSYQFDASIKYPKLTEKGLGYLPKSTSITRTLKTRKRTLSR